MSSNALQFLRFFFSNDGIWGLFTRVLVPGESFSFAQWFLFLPVAFLAIKVITRILSRSSQVGNTSSSSSSSGRSSREN